MLDEFLTELSDITPRIPVLLIAGNHDSAERLNYASGFLEKASDSYRGFRSGKEGEYLKK